MRKVVRYAKEGARKARKPSQDGSAAAEGNEGKASKIRFSWDTDKDDILLKEVILIRPFQFRKKTVERGRAWQQVAEALQKMGFKVNQRAVRDRMKVLMDAVRGRNNVEKAASGIAPDDTEEQKHRHEVIEDLIQEEEDVELAPRDRGDEERKKADAVEMRRASCETFGETRKRQQGEGSTTPKKGRNTGSETLNYLNTKLEMDREMRKQEIEKRAEEAERQRLAEERRREEERARDRRYEMMHEQMMQQQQQMQQQLVLHQQQAQQQNQQMQMMVMALVKALENKNDK
ncbi:uncharacterized protein [Diadema setosum]|uniref:uncharacterized protein n=1 Tax=Diadema setosum TaxID=31175 RepID=UPI003B3B0F22